MSLEGICGKSRAVPAVQFGRGLLWVIAAGASLMPEGSMRRHDWIFDMLSDLQDYALANGLPDLAASIEMTLDVARRETAGKDGPADPRPGLHERTH